MKTGIVIGRFQPLHNAHVELFMDAMMEVDNLIVILGSSTQAKTVKNPWTTGERTSMIHGVVENLGRGSEVSIQCVPVSDYLYNDNLWLSEVQSKLSNLGIGRYDDVTLFGHKKDASTFYLDLFPNMRFRDVGHKGDLCATDVRRQFFDGHLDAIRRMVPRTVADRMFREATDGGWYDDLCEEHRKIEEYKKMWANTPYPVVFVTTDAIVIKSGHILVVRRKFSPGKGLIALPGGFLGQGERLKDGVLRELKEETRIAVRKDEIAKHLVSKEVFDHPDRSARGRTITHAFYFDLGRGDLPRVKGDDDADEAWWMPIKDVLRREEDFFEDHFHIIYNFVMRT